MFKFFGRVALQKDMKVCKKWDGKNGRKDTYVMSVLIPGTKDFVDCILEEDAVMHVGSLQEFDLLEITATGGVRGSNFGVSFSGCTFLKVEPKGSK